MQVGPDLTITGVAVALELVVLAGPPVGPEAVVAANIFHRAVGERLQPGDRLITGSVVQVPVPPATGWPPTSAPWAGSS